MKNKSDSKANRVEQQLLGEHNRICAGDYYEHNSSNWEQKQNYLPMDELDKVAKSNEFYFKQRFGFDASLKQREDILKAKKLLDFTDDDLRCLKKSGALKTQYGQTLCLSADYSLLVNGVIFLLGAIFISSIIPISHFSQNASNFLKSTAIFYSLLLLWFKYILHVKLDLNR